MEENDIDFEGYIKCEVLQFGLIESSFDGNRNVLEFVVFEKWMDDQMGEIFGN